MSLEKIERREAADVDAELAVIFAGSAGSEADLRRLVARATEDLGAPIITYDQLATAVGRAFMMGARVALHTVQGKSPCRVCGCWELEGCDGGCAWAEPGLCTACEPQ